MPLWQGTECTISFQENQLSELSREAISKIQSDTESILQKWSQEGSDDIQLKSILIILYCTQSTIK